MSIRVFPSSLNELYVEWNDVAGDSYNVYRSGSPANGFEPIVTEHPLPFFVDSTVNLYDDGNRYYYQVKGIIGGVEKTQTEVCTWEYNRPDGVATKVIHETDVVLRVMNNPPVQLLIRNRTGTPCPECWNTITKRPRYADCPSCYGTGVSIGYYAPTPLRISMDITQQFREINMEDGDQVSLTPVNAWVANKPIVTPNDVLVDVMDRRFVVQNVIPRTRSQYLIRQILQIIPLPKGHPVYKVNVERGVML